MKIKDSNVLITGGASGIGKIMGRMALEKGAKCLIIWDINEQNIAATIEELSAKGKVKGYRVDVGSVEAIREAYATVKEECGDVDILINNAGIITSNKTFDQVDIAGNGQTRQRGHPRGVRHRELQLLRQPRGAQSLPTITNPLWFPTRRRGGRTV